MSWNGYFVRARTRTTAYAGDGRESVFGVRWRRWWPLAADAVHDDLHGGGGGGDDHRGRGGDGDGRWGDRTIGRRSGRRTGDVALLGGRWPGMLALPVPAQVHLPLERFVAQAARERLVARVLAQVRDQVGWLAECFAAHHALVRFLTWGKRTQKMRETVSHRYKRSRKA